MHKTMIVKLIFKIFLAFLCSLLVWELIISNTIIKTPGTKIHPILGKIYIKGQHLQGQEGFCRTSINSLGMREAEITPKIKNEKRVLFLGDSYTQAVHVHDNKVYVKVFQDEINKISENKISCINGGKSGNSPADYIFSADFYKEKVNPDYVVIQINPRDIKFDLSNKKSFVYVKKEENNFKIAKNFKFKSENPLKEKIPYSDKLVKLSVLRLGGEQFQKIFNVKASNDYEGKKEKEVDYNPIVDWSLKNLKNKYPNLVIVYLPNTCINGTCKEPEELENIIAKYSVKHKIKLINMRNSFLEFSKHNNIEVRGFNNSTPGEGHLNKYGHQLVANELIKYFQNKITLKKGENK